ncbi:MULTISPECIES: two-component system regulatory protein YycI [Bacillaceae]|uniref:Two-component system regulatory protein YycI n=1 Tax=Evansella alkalicola TaxID=745819 RepID=A0ABS6JV25_9BACI|nr:MULTISPECIES: two-component system regulatory protein YycI [Bacillaceae]MBU9722328.1 two-component system regulatory protein YycI [Bacillus alkalicola]
MDWSKTKSIFIITFLLLNLFLGYQLSEKRSERNVNLLRHVTLQEDLDENEITVEIRSTEETKLGSPITGSIRVFNEENLVEQFDNQEIDVLNDGKTIYSTLDSPYRLVDASIPAAVETFVQQHVLYGDEYQFTKFDEETYEVGLHQTFEGRPIDNFVDGPYHLKLYLNIDLEIESYSQEYMDINTQGREQEFLSPMKVVEILFEANHIPANTTLDQAQLGYYNPLQASYDLEFRVFTPMWRVKVNESFYYVSAIEGEIHPMNQ